MACRWQAMAKTKISRYTRQEPYAGICYVNSATIGAEVHLPFGGTKGTVNGHREAGTQVLDIFSEWKSLYIDYSGKLQKAQIDEVEIRISSHLDLKKVKGDRKPLTFVL